MGPRPPPKGNGSTLIRVTDAAGATDTYAVNVSNVMHVQGGFAKVPRGQAPGAENLRHREHGLMRHVHHVL